jgi:hypothetical protein
MVNKALRRQLNGIAGPQNVWMDLRFLHEVGYWPNGVFPEWFKLILEYLAGKKRGHHQAKPLKGLPVHQNAILIAWIYVGEEAMQLLQPQCKEVPSNPVEISRAEALDKI